MFNMDTVDDRANSGATIDQLMEALPAEYPHSFMVVADTAAMSQPDYPLRATDSVRLGSTYGASLHDHGRRSSARRQSHERRASAE